MWERRVEWKPLMERWSLVEMLIKHFLPRKAHKNSSEHEKSGVWLKRACSLDFKCNIHWIAASTRLALAIN